MGHRELKNLNINNGTRNELKVSVIIPVYNVDKFLVQCLESLQQQTLEDIEFICINDGSTDNSLDILNKYAKCDSRFIVINQENQGQGVARNKGLEIARGKYILFVDPDDWIENSTIDELYQYAIKSNADVVQFDYKEYYEYSKTSKIIDFSRKIKRKYRYNLKKTPYFNINILNKDFFTEFGLQVWIRFYSKEFINKSKAKFPPTKQGEDHLFTNAIVLNAEKIHYINKTFYTHRCRIGSAVNSMTNDNFDIFKNIELFEKYLKENGYFEKYQEEFNKYKIHAISWHYKNIPQENIEKYETYAQAILTTKEYQKMQKHSKNKLKLVEWLFSIKNKRENARKFKVITLLGIGIVLRKERI